MIRYSIIKLIFANQTQLQNIINKVIVINLHTVKFEILLCIVDNHRVKVINFLSSMMYVYGQNKT